MPSAKNSWPLSLCAIFVLMNGVMECNAEVPISRKFSSALSMDSLLPLEHSSLPPQPSIAITGDVLISHLHRAVVEGGHPTEYYVSLASQPAKGQIVSIITEVKNDSSFALAQVDIRPRQVNFTHVNWQVAQKVTVTPWDDDIAEQTVDLTIEHSIIGSPPLEPINLHAAGVDGRFAAGKSSWRFVSDLSSVIIRVFDNDEAGLFASRISHHQSSPTMALRDDGWSMTIFSVRINSKPHDEVQVSLSLAGLDSGSTQINPPVMVFQPDSWTVPQTFTVMRPPSNGSIRLSLELSSEDDIYGAQDFDNAMFLSSNARSINLGGINDIETEMRPGVCPAGFVCYESSISENSTAHTVGGNIIEPCPAGSFSPAGYSIPLICPPGFYCPEGASSAQRCQIGTQCAEGTATPELCPLGTRGVVSVSSSSTAKDNSDACELCPAGTVGSHPDRKLCLPCPAGIICPEIGTQVIYLRDSGNLMRSAERGPKIFPEPCPRGHYCPHGTGGFGHNRPPQPCLPGTHQPNIGISSWSSDSNEHPSSFTNVHMNQSSCLSCPPGSYADMKGGHSSCTLCPHSATSVRNRVTCRCIGANRIFRPGLGCICKAKHISYDASLTKVSGGTDSRLDCQPIVFDRCKPNIELRLGNGSCVNAADIDATCDDHCRSTRPVHFSSILEKDRLAGGKVNRRTGHCLCHWDRYAGKQIMNDVSGESAFASTIGIPSAFVDRNGDYVIRMEDGTEVERISSVSSAWTKQTLHRIIGDCPRARLGGPECRVVFVHTNSQGLNMAAFSSALSLKEGPSAAKMQSWERQEIMESHHDNSVDRTLSAKRGRALGLKNTESGEKGLYWEPTNSRPITLETSDNTTIVSPFICISAGEKVVFTFTYNSWPVPVKDAIADWVEYEQYDPNDVFGTLHKALMGLNSADELSPSQTWSPELKNTVSLLSAGVWTFKHTFNHKGYFVFGSFNRNRNTLSPERFIVRVDATGTSCTSTVSPTSFESGGDSDSPLQAPNWELLGGMFGGLVGAVIVVICVLYYARAHDWGSDRSRPRYRARNRRIPMARLHQKASVLKVEEKEAAAKFVSERKMEKPGAGNKPAAITAAAIPKMIAGTLPAGNVNDIDRWDADDLDIRELLERFESNREEVTELVSASDKLAKELSNQVIKVIKDETDELRHLIAQTALENGDDDTKQRLKLFKLLENELKSRNKYDVRAATIEKKSIEELISLKDLSSGGKNGDVDHLAEVCVNEIATQNLKNPATVRSKSVSKVLNGVSSTARTIRKLISMFDGERKRRIKGIAIWNAAVQNGSVDLGSELTQHLEKLRTLDERADKLSRDVIVTLRSFADGADSFGLALAQTVKDSAIHLGEAEAKKSGAESERAKREAGSALTTLFGELEGALEKLSLHANSVNKQLIEARTGVRGERDIVLDMLHALRLSATAAEHGLDHSDHYGEDGEGDIKGKHAREQAALDAKIKKQEDEKVAKLESKLSVDQKMQINLAKQNAELQQQLAATTISDLELTEATANKIMKQYEDDANTVSDMLENERRRQAEIMRSRLAEQRFRRRRNLKKTHDDELKEAEVLKKQEVESQELHEKQEAEYKEVVAELAAKEAELNSQWDREDAEEDKSLADLQTEAAVAEFETMLREQLARPELQNGNDPDKVRRIEHLLSKLEFKKIELMKRKAATEAVNEAKSRNDEAEVERIKREFASNMAVLAKSADAEKRRKKAMLQDRLKRARERRMRDLQHKHEKEANKLTASHNEEASELQDRLDDHDDLARIIHEVQSEDREENQFDTGNAEKEALIDEQQRMRDELRKKQEEESQSIQDEEQEDAVIAEITDGYSIRVTALKLENDLQLDDGIVSSSIHDKRSEEYAKIESRVKILLKKQSELMASRENFAQNESSFDKARIEGETARIREMEGRLKQMDESISDSLKEAETNMKSSRDAFRASKGGDSPRDTAKNRLDLETERVRGLHLEAQKLRESGADTDSVKRAELAYAAAQENLLKRESEYAKEAELERSKMSDRRQKQRDRMLVKLQKKRLETERIKQERERAEKIKELQAKKEIEKKRIELEKQGKLNEAKARELEAEARAAMITHQSNMDSQVEKRKARMEKRLKAKRAQKKLAMQRRHKEEEAKELAMQEEERKKIEGMSVREREMRMLEGIMVRGANEERVDEAIEMIMHDRHATETADLISAQYEERTRVIQQAMQDILDRKRAEIDDTISKIKDSGDYAESQISSAVEQIGKKYALLQAEVQRSAADDLETKHSQAQLDLRQRQLQEIASALSHLAPQDILVKKQAEQKQRQVEELAEFRRTMESESQERIERIKREKAEFEENLKKQNEAEMQRIEKEHQQELENQRIEGERKLKERKEAFMKKQRQQQGLQLAEMGEIDDELRKDIIRKFEEDQRHVMSMMSQERDRQLRVLENKLRSRRERHARRVESKMRESMEQEQKLMRQRIAHVAETAQKSIAQAEHSAKAADLAFKALRKSGNLKGEESSVHMAMIGKMAKTWKHKARKAKETRLAIAKAAKDMQTPAQRAAARAANRGFWDAAPELSEEEQSKLQQKNLEQVERLHREMQKELHQNKNDMSERSKKRHGKLLARLEAKKKRLAERAARAKKAKERKEAEDKKSQELEANQDEATSGNSAGPNPPQTPVARRGGATLASSDSVMQMSIPSAKEKPSSSGVSAMSVEKEAKLFSALSAIEKRLSAMESGSSSVRSSPSPMQRALAGGSKAGPDLFADDRAKDKQFSPEGQLEETDLNDLTDHERQRLAFGSEILKIFGMDRGSRRIEIHVATKLPRKAEDGVSAKFEDNAFSNSFFWDKSTRTLYVRQERLESVGEFALMLVHTLSHIQADPQGMTGSMGDDTDPKFVAQFVKSIKLVTQSLFMSSQQVEKLRLIRPGSNMTTSASSSAAEDEYFKTASIQERMQRYRAFRNRPDLLNFVASIDGDADGSGAALLSSRSEASDLGSRLDQQISILEREVNKVSGEYNDQLARQHGVENAVKDLDARISEKRMLLQPSNKKLTGKKRVQAEEELKHLTKQMFDAQHELEVCETRTSQLMKSKTELAYKLVAKKKAAEKFRKHEL